MPKVPFDVLLGHFFLLGNTIVWHCEPDFENNFVVPILVHIFGAFILFYSEINIALLGTFHWKTIFLPFLAF